MCRLSADTHSCPGRCLRLMWVSGPRPPLGCSTKKQDAHLLVLSTGCPPPCRGFHGPTPIFSPWAEPGWSCFFFPATTNLISVSMRSPFFSRFHVYVRSYGMILALPDLPHQAQDSHGSSTLSQMAALPSFFYDWV